MADAGDRSEHGSLTRNRLVEGRSGEFPDAVAVSKQTANGQSSDRPQHFALRSVSGNCCGR